MKNIPNVLSAFRIALVPVFIAVYFSELENARFYSAGVYALAAFTDFLDGHIARKYNITSLLGRVLDPVGDKLMVVAVMLCITVDGIIPVWAVIVVVVKELLMLVGGVVLHRTLKADIPPSNYIGKSSTVVFFVVCVSLMLFRGIPNNIANIMISAALALTVIALGSYLMTFSAILRERRADEGK